MSDGLTSCKSEPGHAGMGTRSRSRRYASLGQTDEAVLEQKLSDDILDLSIVYVHIRVRECADTPREKTTS
eukprot:481291-Pleurochrysis_carterae.AAC.1